MQLTVIEMLPAHLDQVLAIENTSFPVPWSRQSFVFELLQNEFAYYIVVLQDDKVLGYAGVWVVLDEAHVTNVAVHPEYRGGKIGRLLMTELMRRVSLKGAVRITLEVRTSNAVARNLYSSLGFKELGVRKKYYSDNNEDAIIMWKE
ncbi:MAG: alanine acetyltransferase [Peptococcaceae bacterium BRH_c4b]|nr:MAG: alanine acetyltransferase [Peptococcaceae bacterium BRH_c4b]